MAKVNFLRGEKVNLPTTGDTNTFYVTNDTQSIYFPDAENKLQLINAPATRGTGTNSIVELDVSKVSATGDNSKASGFSDVQVSSSVASKTNSEIVTEWNKGVTAAKNAGKTIDPENTQICFMLAKGKYSHAEGVNTLSLGDNSHAEGGYTAALGARAHSEGSNTIASGDRSHAEGGSYTSAEAKYSHAEACNTHAYGWASHTEGSETVTGDKTKIGVEGEKAGRAAHAEGSGSVALGNASHAEGTQTHANGDHAHSEGYATIASGNESHAEGNSTQATNYRDHAEGAQTLASGGSSHAEGFNTQATEKYSHAEGNTTVASGQDAHAEGGSTKATAEHSHAEGWNTTASYSKAHAEGFNSVASGEASHAEGKATEATAPNAHAEGESTIAKNDGAHAEGLHTVSNDNYQHVAGKYNKQATGARVTGGGSNDQYRRNIEVLDWQGNLTLAGALIADSIKLTCGGGYVGVSGDYIQYCGNGKCIRFSSGDIDFIDDLYKYHEYGETSDKKLLTTLSLSDNKGTSSTTPVSQKCLNDNYLPLSGGKINGSLTTTDSLTVGSSTLTSSAIDKLNSMSPIEWQTF